MAKNNDKIIILAIVGGALFLFMVIAIISVFVPKSAGSDFALSGIGSKIALINVEGVIEKSDDIVRQLKKYQDDGSIKGLVLRVDSPGGGVAASQEIYDQLLKFKKSDKIVVVSMGSVAASGGYYISCMADTIFANPGTITGSIGVIFSFPVFQNLMDKVGIKMEVVKSGALKDVGNPGRAMSPEDRRMLQAVIDNTYSQFVQVVAEGRRLDTNYVKSIADGSIYTGSQARHNGLVDKLGTLEDAIATAGVMADLGGHPRIVRERLLRHTLWEDLLGAVGIDFSRSSYIRPWPTLEYRFNM